MNKSLHPIIIFFWGYILLVRVQCRDIRGILNVSEHKELCFKRCNKGFGADDNETWSKRMFGRWWSCHGDCLLEDDYSNCFPGNADSKAIAMLPDRQTIQFHELRVEGRYQGTIKWEPLRDESVHFTGYKILIVYDLGTLSWSLECEEVTKNVTQYPITYSSSGITKKSRLDFLVVSVPHSDNLVGLLFHNQKACILPPEGPSECHYKPGWYLIQPGA